MHMPIPRNKLAIQWTLLIFLTVVLLSACGGGEGDDGVDNEPPPNVVVTENWDVFEVITIDGEKDPRTLNAVARHRPPGPSTHLLL